MALRLLVFALLNFGALGIGGLFTGPGVASDWYQDLNKAPWTPPGWVFGAAWTLIMVCFTVFMAVAWSRAESRTWLVALFSVQWILNVAWNPVFFHFQAVLPALLIITTLTILVGAMQVWYGLAMQWWILLLLPYFLWLCIASSLNWYILQYN